MRTHALYALLMAITASPGTCQRPNPDYCQQDVDCRLNDKPVCDLTTGMCAPALCANNTDCKNPTPYCATPGRCVQCASADQCGADLFCVLSAVDAGEASAPTGSCVSCRTASDCAATNPVCDTGTCRPCKLHSECGANQLCAKDDLLNTSPMPIAQGTCVPASRIQVVSTNSDLVTALAKASPVLPYIHLVSATPVTMTISLLGGFSATNSKYLHIVGPLADTPPSPTTITAAPMVTITSSTGPAINFSSAMTPGSYGTLVLEGLMISDSIMYGISCSGDGVRNDTQIQLYRSLLTNIQGTAVSVGNECRLTVDQCWIGRSPGALVNTKGGNFQSISVSNSDLLLSNSVFWRNGVNGTSYGGISFNETPGRQTGGFLSSIVNCTFAEQVLDSAQNHTEYDLNCGGDMSQSPVIMNSIFWQDMDPLTLGQTHILPSCYQMTPANMTNLASEDPSITQNNGGVLLMTSPFTNETVGDFSLNGLPQTKPLLSGGVTSVQGVTAPDHDLAGNQRSQTHPTIGALEVPH